MGHAGSSYTRGRASGRQGIKSGLGARRQGLKRLTGDGRVIEGGMKAPPVKHSRNLLKRSGVGATG
jgi:hypothetical protein